MSTILTTLSKMNSTVSTVKRVPMTDKQVAWCKEALVRDERGFNVQPNRYDIANPYRAAVFFNQKWYNFGNFKNADVAAACGSILAGAFFGSKAIAGKFDHEVVSGHEEFVSWCNDPRNAQVIAMANGDEKNIQQGGVINTDKAEPADVSDEDESEEEEVNPF